MSQYNIFSTVYDLFMDNVPYENWADRIEDILKQNNIDDGLVLDLGCGTGTLTEMLSDRGYDMIGIDSSEDMLAEAQEKHAEKLCFTEYADTDDEEMDDYLVEGLNRVGSGSTSENNAYSGNASEKTADILYLCQDLSEFELYGTVRAVISSCDTLNYITEPDKLLDAFKLINNYLEPDGVFIFDINAPEKYEKVLADNVFAENREDASFIWENTYDSETGINEYALTLFIKDEEEDFYEKYEEYHYQKSYSREEIKQLLNEAGMEIVSLYEEDLRLFYVVKVSEGKKLGNY